jgi:hypothetical protein
MRRGRFWVRLLERMASRVLGRPMFAMAWLTAKAALRYRLVQILSVLLLTAVVFLPAIIKHDGTARGFTQILLSYSLGSVTMLLGFATLWLACGTLARDVEECQMQMVAVKPIARWEIWLGKWLGLVLLNGLLLAMAGAAIYGVLSWRSRTLPPEALEELRAKVLVARGSIREAVDTQGIEAEVNRRLAERLQDANVAAMDRSFVLQQIREQVRAQYQIVRPGMARRWVLDFGARGARLKETPLSVRAKFIAAQATVSGTYYGFWEIGPPEGRRYRPEAMSLAPDTFHEFFIPPGLIDSDGRLTVDFLNYNDTAILFPLEEGLEVLYAAGGFAPNFARGMAIIFCWIALLAAIGLAAASFLSFPVAAFLSLGLLVIGFSTGTLRQVVTEGGIAGVNANTGLIDEPGVFNRAAVKVFGGLLAAINLAQDFSPVESLSSGRMVTWGEVGRACLQVVLLMGGFFGAVGVVLFTRRELAAAQSG